MATEAVKCPSCGASVHQPPGRPQFFCSFCGSLVTVQNNALTVERVVRQAARDFVCPVCGKHLEQADYTCPQCGREVCQQCYGQRPVETLNGTRWVWSCLPCGLGMQEDERKLAQEEWERLQEERAERQRNADRVLAFLLWQATLWCAIWLACIATLGDSEYLFFWQSPSFAARGGWTMGIRVVIEVLAIGIGVPALLMTAVHRYKLWAARRRRRLRPTAATDMEVRLQRVGGAPGETE